MKEKDTAMGKAFLKAVPTFGSGGPGDEPVRVGVGQRPLTTEELFNGYLNSLEGLSPEAKIAALTAVGIGTAAAGQLVRGLSKGLSFRGESFNPMNPKAVASVTSLQNSYQQGLKDFTKYASQISPVPQPVLDDIKKYGSGTASAAIEDYAKREIMDAYDNYRVIPTRENKSVLNNIVNKYGGLKNVTIGEDSIEINPNSKYFDSTNRFRLSILNEELANTGALRAQNALDFIKNYTGLPTAEAEKLAAKPTVSGAVRSGLGAVGNAYTNALSFLRGGGGPKITGR